MIALFFTTYAAVFFAEIAGDKLLYTTGVLSARYRPLPILVGVTIAFMAKMAVAVAVGEAISRLPPLLVAGGATGDKSPPPRWRRDLRRRRAPRSRGR